MLGGARGYVVRAMPDPSKAAYRAGISLPQVTEDNLEVKVLNDHLLHDMYQLP